MSPRKHTWMALVGSVLAVALLSGCFGSGDGQPAAASHHRHHRGATSSGTPSGSPATSSPTEATSSPTAGSASMLRFSPRSGGKHLDDCQKLVPGDDPAEFLYYPVVVRTTSPVDLDTVSTDHTQGVVDAAAWVAPVGSTPETGTFKGWPPASIVTHDSNLRWKDRVPAAGASLEPGGSYNLFLRLQVDPTPGDSEVDGIVFSYHDANGSHTDTWRATTTFSMSC